MSKIDTGGSLWPWTQQAYDSNRVVFNDIRHDGSKTWLDECAMRAMQGIVKIEPVDRFSSGTKLITSPSDIAAHAYNIAKAMLAEKRRLEKGDGE